MEITRDTRQAWYHCFLRSYIACFFSPALQCCLQRSKHLPQCLHYTHAPFGTPDFPFLYKSQTRSSINLPKHTRNPAQVLVVLSLVERVSRPIVIHAPRPELLSLLLPISLNERILTHHEILRHIVAAENRLRSHVHRCGGGRG